MIKLDEVKIIEADFEMMEISQNKLDDIMETYEKKLLDI